MNIETISDCHPESEFSLLVSALLVYGQERQTDAMTTHLLSYAMLFQPELIFLGELPRWQIGHLETTLDRRGDAGNGTWVTRLDPASLFY